MTDYGEFISKGPYVSGAEMSVDIAVRKDGLPGSLILKRFHPPPSRFVRRVLLLEAWRLSMERQQRAARAGAAAVEVLAVGSYSEGEYAVFPRNRRSLSSIVSAVTPTGDRLRIMVGRILAALKSWEIHYGSPHGNLKPSNIFVVGEGPLQNLSFVLSDPWWRLGTPSGQLRSQELSQLGGLIVQMVRGRQAGLAPIEDAPEWRRLGRSGAAWRDFGNFLLDGNGDPAALTLEAAETRLRAIPADFPPGRVAAVGGVSVSLMLCGATLTYARLGDVPAMPGRLLWLAEKTGNPHAFREQTSREWSLLCRAWEEWAGDIAAQATKLEQTKELWVDGDPLRAAIASFRLKAEALRPQTIAAQGGATSKELEGRSLASLVENPPRAVRREKVARQLVEAWKEVSALQLELDSWWRWAQLRSLREDLAAVEKDTARAQVEPVVPNRAPSGADPTSGTTLKALLRLANDDAARSLLAPWKEWQDVSSDLIHSGDRVQAAMPRLALQAIPDTSDLRELAGSIAAAVIELRRRRALFLAPNVDRQRFLSESALLSEKRVVVREDLERWELEVRLFSQVPRQEDPREIVTWDSRFLLLQASAAELELEPPSDESPTGVPLFTRAEFEKEVERFRAQVKTLRARKAIRRDLPDLTLQTEQTLQTMRALDQRLDATLALLRPDRWLAGVAARTWPYASARERWNAWRSERLANLSAPVLERDQPRFRSLRQEEQAVRIWLSTLDRPTGMGPSPSLAEVPPEIATEIEKMNTALREKTAAVVIAEGEWKGGLPRGTFEETLQRSRVASQAVDEYRKWAGDQPATAADLAELRRVLAEDFGWSDGVAEAAGKASRHRNVNTMEGEPRTWFQAAQHLRELAESRDLNALGAAITDENLGAGLTAWRRLGELPEWLSDSQQLARELDFGATLRTKIGKLSAATRRAGLTSELAEGQRARWVRLASDLLQHRPEQVDEVFAKASAVDVDPNALEPWMTYDFRLWELRRRIESAAESSELKAARDAFLAQVKRLTALAENGRVTGFLNALSAVSLNPEEPAGALRTPRQARWSEELSPDRRRITATWANAGRKVTLEYQLIEPSDATAPFFLARRTVAVGEFLDLLAAHPERATVLKTLPSWVRGKVTPPVNMIMAWRPRTDRAGLELSDSWFYNPEPLLKGLLETHPKALAAANEPPTARSPLQFISPETAKVFVEKVLGARLPSLTEWKALSATGKAVEGTFRSEVFTKTWNYTANVRLNPGGALTWRPTLGAFLPRLESADTRSVGVDDGRGWLGAKSLSLWPVSVDDGLVEAENQIIQLYGNVWIYLFDEAKKEYYTAGGSILAAPTIDIHEPQRIQTRSIMGLKLPGNNDGFSDVGVRPAFDAPVNIRQRLQLFRLVRTQPFITR